MVVLENATDQWSFFTGSNELFCAVFRLAIFMSKFCTGSSSFFLFFIMRMRSWQLNTGLSISNCYRKYRQFAFSILHC